MLLFSSSTSYRFILSSLFFFGSHGRAINHSHPLAITRGFHDCHTQACHNLDGLGRDLYQHTMAAFLNHFRAEKNANLVQAKRWWAQRHVYSILLKFLIVIVAQEDRSNCKPKLLQAVATNSPNGNYGYTQGSFKLLSAIREPE